MRGGYSALGLYRSARGRSHFRAISGLRARRHELSAGRVGFRLRVEYARAAARHFALIFLDALAYLEPCIFLLIFVIRFERGA
ncbi:MAG: hypothetical protein M0R66_03065 [Candidatus Omnitrophica bacterium]|nr:hypothetical protein [Candidatus Omnitrophota bacterium]